MASLPGQVPGNVPEEPARLRYGQVTGEDKDSLEAYLVRLQDTRVSRLSRPEQKAFWMNLYNAMTVAVVLRNYPVGSILEIDPPRSGSRKGPWDAQILAVEGKKLTLNEVEHRILRPIWSDNLVHFGLNCASLGCPDLPPRAFTAENTGNVLEQAARTFIRSARGAVLSGDTLHLSSLFDWYRSDFAQDEKQLLAFLSRFAAPAFQARLAGFAGPIRYRYDWRLNDAPSPGRGGR